MVIICIQFFNVQSIFSTFFFIKLSLEFYQNTSADMVCCLLSTVHLYSRVRLKMCCHANTSNPVTCSTPGGSTYFESEYAENSPGILADNRGQPGTNCKKRVYRKVLGKSYPPICNLHSVLCIDLDPRGENESIVNKL